MPLNSTGKNVFELVEEQIMSNERDDLIKVFLEADLASQPELTSFTAYPPLAETWRAACNEAQWIIAKHLLRFEDSSP